MHTKYIDQVKIIATKTKQNTMIHFHSFKMDPALKLQHCLLQSNHSQPNHYPDQAQVTNFI